VTTSAATAPVPSLSARQTLVKIADAVRTGDADLVASHTSWSTPGQKMVDDNQGRTCASVAKFRRAYSEAFGQAALDQLPQMVGPTFHPEPKSLRTAIPLLPNCGCGDDFLWGD
jgi:hypothetical protein